MQRLAGHDPETVLYEGAEFRKPASFQYLVAPVRGIAKQWVAEMLHVGPDLMCSACFQPALDECYKMKAFQYPVMGYRPFPFFLRIIDLHYLPVFLGPANVAVYRPLPFQIAPYQGQVTPSDGMIKELFGKQGHGQFLPGDKQQTGGILVDPVYQARPSLVTPQLRQAAFNRRARIDTGTKAHVIKQGVHQGTAVLIVTRMHNHSHRY